MVHSKHLSSIESAFVLLCYNVSDTEYTLKMREKDAHGVLGFFRNLQADIRRTQ